MQEIGLFCGTFNPIHIGHLLMAECARDQYSLSKVLFVTSALPPHRRVGLLDSESRHEMVVAAIADNKLFEASRLEIDRPGPSYTVDTVRAVLEMHRDAHANLIIGEDNLPYLSQWHEAEEMIKLCRLLVAPRDFPTPNPKYDHEHPLQKELPGATIEFLDFPLVPISASIIRDRLKHNRSVRYMVAPEVNDILVSKQHYRDLHIKIDG